MNPELDLQATLAGRLRALPELAHLPILLEADEDFETKLAEHQAGTHRLYLIISCPEQAPPEERHVSTVTALTTLGIELAYQTGPGPRPLRPSAATRLITRQIHGLPGPNGAIFYRGYTTASTDTRYSRVLAFDTYLSAY